jgi:hypothetical protein
MNTNYANNGFYAPAHPQQQVEQPQFISPAQLFQQPPASSLPPHPSQHRINGRAPSNPPAYNSPMMAPLPAANTQPDTASLLIALAEEYFQAAHELAPAVALSMTVADVEAYEGLIATGLGCLDTALRRVKLQPRVEANIRLRYAGVLFEETENSMEAETALTKGIALCERVCLGTLGICRANTHSESLLRPQICHAVLASTIHGEEEPESFYESPGWSHLGCTNVSNCQLKTSLLAHLISYQHFSWVYVFRFLRASHALESSSLTDHHAAVQNLRAVANLAKQQNDNAIHLTASLMEALAFLKIPGPEALQHVETALAQAWSFQMDESCKIPQIISLTHILAVSCALRKGNSQEMLIKLKEMQVMMDKTLSDNSWSSSSDVIVIPINRTPKSSHTVSRDTRMILGIGDDGGDNLMMSFLSKRDAYCIT